MPEPSEHHPTGDLRGALAPVKGTHFAVVTDPKQTTELLRPIETYTGTPSVAAALKLVPLVFVRPGELRKALWAYIDFEAAEWRYLVTKTKTEHIAPLAHQAIAILLGLQPITGRGRYVFPSGRGGDRPLSDNGILSALRRLEIPKEEMCGHCLRAMAHLTR